jgi:hypothetical protein
VDVAAVAVGAVLVAVVAVDLTSTLVVTWGSVGRWRPTRWFYRGTWWAWSSIGRRLRHVDRQQRFLAVYAPLSLLFLLGLWLTTLVLGWALVWTGLRSSLPGVSDFGDAVYYSGVVLLTIGFGDITATGMVPRLLTLAEAAMGLASIALVISYLPVLYGAYGRREAKLLTLDLPSGERITPAGLVISQAPDADLVALGRFFAGWEQWMAEVLESHTSYPMLAFFRSQHRGQSWITALGVVLDAATFTVASVPGTEVREPFFAYRRGRRAVEEIAARVEPPPVVDTFVNREAFEYAYGLASAAGLPLRPFEEAFARLAALREGYGERMQALFDHLVAPPGFWGHSAGDSLAQPVIPGLEP